MASYDVVNVSAGCAELSELPYKYMYVNSSQDIIGNRG